MILYHVYNTIFDNNVYDVFPPVRTPFLVSFYYFEIATDSL